MVRATNRTKKKATNFNAINQTDPGVLSAMKAFSGIHFTAKPFKKKAKSSKKGNKAVSLIKKGLKTIHNLVKSTKAKAKPRETITHDTAIPFTKVYRNKPKQNYTNKSSHLSNITAFKSKLMESDDEQNQDKNKGSVTIRNNKKAKRSQRRKQLKQRIESANKWTMETQNTENVNDTQRNEEKTSLSIESLRDSLTETEKEIILERKHKNKQNCKRQMGNDREQLTALFTNQWFDSDPIQFTKNRLKQENDEKIILSMKCEEELKQLKQKDDKKQRNYEYKMRKKERKRRSLVSDHEWKKQMGFIKKQKYSNIKKQIKLTSKSNKKMKLSKKKNKSGQYVRKKMREKMSGIAKANQKKRRWRI